MSGKQGGQGFDATGRLGLGDLPAFARTIAIGTAGGAIFNWLQMPLPWMLGAMLAAGTVTLSGVRTCVDGRVRTVMIVVLGVLLGSAFTPDILDRIALWPATLGGLLAFVLVGTLATYTYFRCVGFDRSTAFYAGVPGGLNVMVVLADASGADARQVSIAHSTRIFLVVMILPFLFRLIDDLPPGVQSFNAKGHAIEMVDVAVLVACAAVGSAAAKLIRMPAPTLTGPMIASAAVHLTGLTAAAPPIFLVAASQIVIGSSIGARFAGLSFRDLGRILWQGGVATAILLAIAAAFALAFNHILGIGFEPLILAYSPGGLTEMSLVALALHVDAAFVACHHIARIGIVVLIIPLMYRFIDPDRGIRRMRRGDGGDGNRGGNP